MFLFEPCIQSLEGGPGVEPLAFDRVLADDDAARGIFFGIARMDQYSEKMRYVMQIRQPAFESRAVFECYFLLAGRNGGPGIDFFLAGARLPAQSVGTFCRKVAYRIFDGITEEFAVKRKVSYCICSPLEFASECQFHISIPFISKE